MSEKVNSNGDRNATYWDPTYLTSSSLQSRHKDSPPLYAAIILNQPIEDKWQLLEVCKGAKTIVYADGGANQVFDLAKSDEERKALFPTAICGDLDSIEPNVEEWYASKGVAIARDPDQYSTDLAKSLKFIKGIAQEWSSSKEHAAIENTLNAVLVGGIGGRFDQGFSQLHHLYTASEDEAIFGGQLFLINPQSICFLLCKGLNHIQTPIGQGLFGENIGIIPISRPSVITTKGLEWDLDHQLTEFGGLLSTSNHIKREWIEIETSERVLLTIELDSLRGKTS